MYKAPKAPTTFICETCNFNCSKKKDYNRHLSTAKHQNLTNPNATISNTIQLFKCKCGKTYKHMSSLCSHKSKCTFQLENTQEVASTQEVAPTQEVDKRDDISEIKEMMMMMIKSQMHSQESTKGLLQETQRHNQETLQETLKESQRHHKEFLKETLQRQNQETVNVVNKVIELLDCISKK
jgi:hypothetical protein